MPTAQMSVFIRFKKMVINGSGVRGIYGWSIGKLLCERNIFGCVCVCELCIDE